MRRDVRKHTARDEKMISSRLAAEICTRRGHLKYHAIKKRNVFTANIFRHSMRKISECTTARINSSAIKARRVTDVSNKPHRQSFYWAIKFYRVARVSRYYNASVLRALSTPLKTHFRELSRRKSVPVTLREPITSTYVRHLASP